MTVKRLYLGIGAFWIWVFFLYTSPIHAQVYGEQLKEADRTPTSVKIALRIDQLVSINQKHGHFTAVASLFVRYQDPALAYEKQAGDHPFKLLRLGDFIKYAQERGTGWPGLIFDNQQGRRDISTELVAVTPSGEVRYLQRFTANFQAPDLDFRSFPFDEQEFRVNLTSVLPTDFYVFEEIPGISGMGDELGEEEWVVSGVSTQVSTVMGQTGEESSRFTLTFRTNRHLTYYVARIFIPVFIILLVSWFTFLLRDYVKRTDVGITTLLLFIAFNFAVSSDLPRLGYITAIDAFMTGTFMITGSVLLVNVVFRRLQLSGREELALRMDRYTLWGYWPAYILGMSVTLLWL